MPWADLLRGCQVDEALHAEHERRMARSRAARKAVARAHRADRTLTDLQLQARIEQAPAPRIAPAEVQRARDAIDAKRERLLELVDRLEVAFPRCQQRTINHNRPRFDLTEDECWRMACWNGGPVGRVRRRVQLLIIDHKPTKCEHCGSRDLWYNGATWWCNACDRDTYDLEYAEVYEEAFPGPETPFFVGSSDDRQYAEETALYRMPAASNRPRGWNDPHLNESRREINARGRRARMMRAG